MYCPRCGQQQISEEMRFCSRCGLPMSGFAEWLAGGVPAPLEQKTPFALMSPRRKGIRRGAKVMFFSGALLPIFLIMSIAVDEPGPLMLPFISFIVGLTITLYSRFFAEDLPTLRGQQTQTFNLGSMGTGGQALPPASSIPIYGNPAGQQVRTNDLAQRPSVTEHTTKLFDKE